MENTIRTKARYTSVENNEACCISTWFAIRDLEDFFDCDLGSASLTVEMVQALLILVLLFENAVALCAKMLSHMISSGSLAFLLMIGGFVVDINDSYWDFADDACFDW